MEEEVKKQEGADVKPENGLDSLRKRMEILTGETLDDAAVLKAAEDYITKQAEMNERMSDAMANDPRLAQVFADLAGGKRSAGSSLVRYFGKGFMTAEEGTPEYEDLMKAEEEFRADLEAATKAKEEYNANIEKSMEVLGEFCKENGYEEDDFLDKLSEIILPILSGVYTMENLERIDKALRYDKDVADAEAAGEIKGRNTNIRDMREDIGDGMARVQSAAPPVTPKTKKFNPLISSALNA